MVTIMETTKSLDLKEIMTVALTDASRVHGEYFSTRALRLTLNKCLSRLQSEGIGFFTKTMPRLGKLLDKHLASDTPFNNIGSGFKTRPGASFPNFLGELFERVFDNSGVILPDADATCVRTLRQLLYLSYKYELPYSEEQEDQVIEAFKASERDLASNDELFIELYEKLEEVHTLRTKSAFSGERCDSYVSAIPFSPCPPHYFSGDKYFGGTDRRLAIAQRARIALSRVFSTFDPHDIQPRHGPGAVAQKQKRSAKFIWTNVSGRITEQYPLDAYFYASLGHVCDKGSDPFKEITTDSLSARVCLVPKDSRGPRLISCEPVDYQWIQQGMLRSLVRHIEDHPLTKGCVNFTNQEVNQKLALHGSRTGDFATLDLKEASDRIHRGLVRLLYPEHIFVCLDAMRSSSTVLPNGEVLQLRKFAPMGSAICFPVLALTIWALLVGSAPNADIRKNIYVYGDDVIVPTAFAEEAMTTLELFGLMINKAKSCFQGFFRESCGMDAFRGIDVTPVRLRTVWNESPAAGPYESWISYANSFFSRGFTGLHDLIRDRLHAVYGAIPEYQGKTMSYPGLIGTLSGLERHRRRYNPSFQKFEYHVRVVESKTINEESHGWIRLLRFFSENGPSHIDSSSLHRSILDSRLEFDSSKYAIPRATKVVRRWR